MTWTDISSSYPKGSFLAFVIFGLGSWIIANSLFVEVSALYTRVPEGEELSAYILLALQSANIIPILYMSFNEHQNRISTQKAIWYILALGVIVSLSLAGFWNWTFGTQHSVLFLLSVFLAGVVGSMTNVLFYGFVSAFPAVFTSALAIGEGCSGFIAGAMGLLQDSGNTRALKFSISAFFSVGAIVFFISAIAFAYLIQQKEAKDSYSASEARPLIPVVTPSPKRTSFTTVDVWRRHAKAFVCQFCICFMAYGVVPAVMPYFCDKYARGSEFLKWSSVLSMASDPLARSLTACWRNYGIFKMAFILLSIGVLIVYEALISSHAFWGTSTIGGVFPVICNICFSALFAYTQTMVFLEIKKESKEFDTSYAQATYEWSGLLTQLGGTTGSVLVFFAISK